MIRSTLLGGALLTTLGVGQAFAQPGPTQPTVRWTGSATANDCVKVTSTTSTLPVTIQDSGSGCSGGGGSGTVSSGTGPAIAQYQSGTSTTVVSSTVSGDATIAQGGAVTVSKIGGVSVSLGGALTTGGAVTFFGAYTATLNLLGNTTVTLPSSGTLMTNALTSGDIFLGNGSNVAAASTLTAALDSVFGSTQGSILYRNSSAWVTLGPGTNGYFLETQGASANPVWAAVSGGSGCSVSGGSQYQILVDNGSSGCASSTSTVNTGVLTLGSAGTASGVVFSNATSGTVTLQPQTGALGTVTLSLPAATDQLVGRATTDTLTNKSIAGSEINSGTVGSTYGGTGVNNGSSTITLGGNLTTSGAYPLTLTQTASTNVTLPASGTLATTANIATALPSATSSQLYIGTGAAGAAAAASTLPTGAEPAHTGDMTNSAGSLATTVGHVDGVAYPASPSVNTVPVVTSATSGGTVTYEAVPNAALANAATTVNGQTCTLGSTCTVTATASTIAVGTTTVTGGTNNYVLSINGSGVLADIATGTSGGVLPLLNGNNIYSGTSAFTGALPAVASGQGSIAGDATNGLELQGEGATNDFTLLNNAGTAICNVPTGATYLNCTGLRENNHNINLGGTLTTAGNFGISGAYTSILTLTSATNVTLPTSGTLATTANINTALPSATSAQIYIGTGTAGVAAAGTMSGDCTTASSLVITCTKINGQAVTLGGAFTTSGAYTTTLTETGNTNVTLPTSGTLASLSAAQSWTAPQRTNTNSPTISTSTFTPVFSTSQNYRIALSSACPCTLANPAALVAGQSGMFEIVQDATGSRTIGTWGSEYLYAGGTSSIALSTGANAVDYLPYYVESTGASIVLGGIVKGPTH